MRHMFRIKILQEEKYEKMKLNSAKVNWISRGKLIQSIELIINGVVVMIVLHFIIFRIDNRKS